jgi:uncharacterized repeat protein (TIGR03803 family)
LPHRIRIRVYPLTVMALTLVSFCNARGAERVLYKFNFSGGPVDPSPVIFDNAGNMYGVTYWGGITNSYCGASGCGTVFELARNSDGSWTRSVLYKFTGGADGLNPASPLIFDAGGNLYGVTVWGGTYTSQCLSGCGTVFELSPAGSVWTHKVLFSFAGGTDGLYPSGNLLFDNSNNLYGTSQAGGAYNQGTVFELTPNGDGSSWTESLLHQFTGGSADGELPQGLVFDAAGDLVGTADFGGSSTKCDGGCGIAYELASGSWTETVLHSFGLGEDASQPQSTLTLGPDGKFFGTSAYGGSHGLGTVFSLTAAGDGSWTEQVLHSFAGGVSDGNGPSSGLLIDGAGNLYGTTAWGGSTTCGGIGCGTVYELTRTSGGLGLNLLYSFQGGANDGATPNSLAFGPENNLYGGTTSGGNGGYNIDGVLFEITR